jgi:hypothetical protein
MLLINLMFIVPLLCALAALALLYTLWRSSKVVEIDPHHIEKLFGVPLLKQSWDGVERRSGIDRRGGGDRRRGAERRKFDL